MMNKMIIDGKTCYIQEHGSGGPIILFGSFPFQENEQDVLWDCIMQVCHERDFVLCVYMVENWKREFSPWPAKAVFKGEDFSGEGAKTLAWLKDSYIPYLRNQFGERKLVAAGYSLAGLFSLWCAYEADLFDAVVCGSGSLWYPGWDVYVREHHVQKDCHIYLSLGRKEEKTRNAVMALVGNRTREQEKLLLLDNHVQGVILEWNDGGHFAGSEQRMSKGIGWVLACVL